MDNEYKAFAIICPLHNSPAEIYHCVTDDQGVGWYAKTVDGKTELLCKTSDIRG